MTSKLHLYAGVAALLLSASPVALAQGAPEANSESRALIERVVREGCSPSRINSAMREVALGRLADWLASEGKAEQAKRVRSLAQQEDRDFQSAEDKTIEFLTVSLDGLGRGDRWDAGRNLATASTLLGGIDGLVRYVAAARDVQIEVYRSPTAFLYSTPGLDLSSWVRSGEAGAGMTALPTDMRYVPVRAAFEIPYNLNRYLIQGVTFPRIYTPYADATISVNTAALTALEETRMRAARAIRNRTDVPLRETLSEKMAQKPDTPQQPTDAADMALTYAAWMPNLCLTYQHTLSPIYLSQKIIEERYIPLLKKNGTW